MTYHNSIVRLTVHTSKQKNKDAHDMSNKVIKDRNLVYIYFQVHEDYDRCKVSINVFFKANNIHNGFLSILIKEKKKHGIKTYLY